MRLYMLCPLVLLFSYSTILGQETVDTSALMRLLNEGVTLKEQGDYNKAFEITNLALESYEREQFNFPRLKIQLERNKGGILLDMGLYEAALLTFKESLKYTEEKFADKDELVVRLYIDVGISNYYLKNYDLALLQYENAEKIALSLGGENFPLLSNCYNNIGICYYVKQNYKKALDYYKKALDIGIKIFGKNDLTIASTYNNIGICYKLMQDYARAIVFYDNALAIKLKRLDESHPKLAPNYNNLGSCYNSLQQYEKALEYYNKGAGIIERNFGTEHPQLAPFYNNIGNCYAQLREFPTALNYLNQAMEIRKKTFPGFNAATGDGYANIGDCYFKQWQYDLAMEYYQKALDYFEQKKHEYPDRIASFQVQIASCFTNQGKFNEARKYFDRGLKSIHYKDVDFENPGRHFAPDLLADFLSEKANMLVKLYTLRKNIEDLKEAELLFDQCIKVLEFLKTGFQEGGSKQILLDNFFNTYEGAIAVCHQLHQWNKDDDLLHRAFEYAERSNNILLQESVQKTQAERYADIPQKLLEQEHELKVDIAFYERKRFNEEQKGKEANQSKINDWNNKIFELKQSYFVLMDRFEKEYPKYYELKYASQTIPVSEIQNDLLKGDEAFVEYFVGDDHIFVFVITTDSFAMEYIPKLFPLEAWVEEFRNSIIFYNPLREDIAYLNQKYVNLANELYELLFVPVSQLLAGKKLIIVPGGMLGHLPFEALLTAAPEKNNTFQSFPYLINKYSISYSYSALLHKEMSLGGINKPGKQFLGFAPRFDTILAASPAGSRTYELGALEYNIPEVKAIAELMDGSQFLDSMATENRFLDTASHFQIIHLATHGKSNDQSSDYSFLAFYEIKDSIENELLYVKDLYNLDLQADMVVLSACETGVGELLRGEGIISLARGFFYAGAKSIITTLWSIDDKPTAEIMEIFYKNLKKGDTKDHALRSAKLSYIQKQHSDMRCHPRFWAGFVPLGNMEALELKEKSNMGYWLIGVFAVLFAGLRIYKLNGKGKNKHKTKFGD